MLREFTSCFMFKKPPNENQSIDKSIRSGGELNVTAGISQG